MTNNESIQEQGADKYIAELLDAYFMFRRNMPGDGLIEEPKSTDEIIDELNPMVPLYGKKEGIFDYMLEHGYGFTTLADGSVKWAIWRLTEGDL